MRTVSSITNNMTAGHPDSTAAAAHAAAAPPTVSSPAAPGGAAAPVAALAGSPTAANNASQLATNEHPAQQPAGFSPVAGAGSDLVPQVPASPQPAAVQDSMCQVGRQDSVGLVTRAAAKVAGGPDAREGGGLDRADSGVLHPKKRGRFTISETKAADSV